MSNVPSPCINLCRMARGLCAGCGRTLDEIAQWSVLDDEQKRAVWAVLPERIGCAGVVQAAVAADD